MVDPDRKLLGGEEETAMVDETEMVTGLAVVADIWAVESNRFGRVAAMIRWHSSASC